MSMSSSSSSAAAPALALALELAPAPAPAAVFCFFFGRAIDAPDIDLFKPDDSTLHPNPPCHVYRPSKLRFKDFSSFQYL